MRPDDQNAPSSSELLQLVRLGNINFISDELRKELRQSLENRINPIEPPTTTPPLFLKQIDLKIRDLMELDAPWSLIAPWLWQRYELSGADDSAAAIILEAASLQASSAEILECFSELLAKGHHEFYWLLHPNLRDFILEHSVANQSNQLYLILSATKSSANLTILEHLFIFLKLTQSPDKTVAWLCFRRNQSRFMDFCNDSGHFGLTSSQLIYKFGETALQVGHDFEAESIFKHLPQNSNERSRAAECLQQSNSHSSIEKNDSYTIRLEQSGSFEEGLKLIQIFCQEIRLNHNISDFSGQALNSIFREPHKWIGDSPDVCKRYTEILFDNRDLQQRLPDIFSFLLTNAEQFHRPLYERSIWQTAATISPKTAVEMFVCSVANLHLFMVGSSQNEDLIWSSRSLALKMKTADTDINQERWARCVKSAMTYCEKSNHLSTSDKKRILSTLNICLNGVDSSTKVIFDYLDHSTTPHLEVLAAFNELGASHDKYEIVLKIEAKRALVIGFENRNLETIWLASSKTKRPDLAWRTASVLAAR